MPAVNLCPTAGAFYQAFTSGGVPLNAGQIFSYAAGTTNPQPTYTTSAGTVANTNPVILLADGRPPAEIWLDSTLAYRFDLNDSLSNQIASFDNIRGIGGISDPGNSAFLSVFSFMTDLQIADVLANTALIDVTAAIQLALDSVAQVASPFSILDNVRGNTLYFPHGTYRVSTTLNVHPGTKIKGAGSNSTRLLNESAAGDVLSFTDVVTGGGNPADVEDIAIAQKQSVVHAAGYAIRVAGSVGNTYTTRLRNVYTYGTKGGTYLDWSFPNTLDNVRGFVHENAFLTRFNTTATTFLNCYGAACTGSGYKLASQYFSCINCASDSNALDGYEVYFDAGGVVGASFISCGSENYLRNGISLDRVITSTIITPDLITGTGGVSGISTNGQCGDITIISPSIASLVANANPAINLQAINGGPPNLVHVLGWDGICTGYANAFNAGAQVFQPGGSTQVGMKGSTLRLGNASNFNESLQTVQWGTDFPVGVGGTSYLANYVPRVTGSYTFAASAHYKPVVVAGAGTVGILVSGPYIEAPTITSGTVSRIDGMRIDDMPAGASADANQVIGTGAIPTGRWSVCNMSTKANLQAGPTQWLTNAGPKDFAGTGTPEGVVAAAIGSTFRRIDGGAATSFYVKESGAATVNGWVAK